MGVQMLLRPDGLVFALNKPDGFTWLHWGPLPFYGYREDDPEGKRLGIALLAIQGMAYTNIGKLFGVCRQTVKEIESTYRQSGIKGLREYHQGPVRIDEATCTFVINEYLRLNGTRGWQNKVLEAIAAGVKAGKFTTTISRSKMQKIINKYKHMLEKNSSGQLHETAPGDAMDNTRGQGVPEQDLKDCRATTLQSELAILEDPMCVEYGGSAVVIPLLGQLGLGQALPAATESVDTLYSTGELAICYTALNAAQCVEVEQDFKLVHSDQMGGIIGRKRLPCLSVFRQRIPLVVAKMNMPRVMCASARQAIAHLGPTSIAYIDGHFMPYYGETATLYGYNTQKRLAMPGREYVYVHDQNGVPIFAALSDGYRKMQYYVANLDSAIREIYGVAALQILAVFDRGGYSKDFLIGICDRIKFICWRIDARQPPEIPQDAWIDVSVEHQGNTIEAAKWKLVQAWERQTTLESEGEQRTFREIWIRSGQKVSPALSNDRDRTLPQLVVALTGRWGNQENMFKDLKAHGIDRIHSYQNEAYSAEHLYARGLEEQQQGVQHTIGNPEIRKINRELKHLRGERVKLTQKLETATKNSKGNVDTLQDGLSRLDSAIASQVANRDTVPKTILMMDRITNDGILRLCDGKKMFFDWLKMHAVWSMKMLIRIVKPFYKDLRDVNKFVLSILRSRTTVYRVGDTLNVVFPRQRSKKSGLALGAVCDALNAMPPFDLGLSFKKMVFTVESIH